ncbi:MAG: hypothetical protein PHP58_05030 [Eubacteriales bacterium]|nr:hypothetical protein [Eubacteriales bacterium]
MDLISDTNIWIDFQTIHGLELPFRLSHRFYLSTETIKDEFLVPPGITNKLVELGLIPLELNKAEYFTVPEILASHPRLSRYDALALSIAIKRKYILLTGDKALRKAGEAAKVTVKGTLWIFDELKRDNCITNKEYQHYLNVLLEHNGKTIRLPKSEILKRL